jgi:outer membrane protein assembly factor BamB
MTSKPTASRTTALVVTVGIFAVVVAAAALWRPIGTNEPGPAQPGNGLIGQAQAAEPITHGWPLFGGSLGRNMVNTVEKNMPDSWDVKKKKNLKWQIRLGSRSYGGPVIANGKILVGTNNDVPRDPKYKGDKGVIMCFNEADGKFLWQAVHDKLGSGLVNDWPDQGICSTPFIDGDFAYYVSNRSEVVCIDMKGPEKGTDAKVVWKYDMIKELDNFPHNLSVCSPLVVGDMVFVVTANGVDEGHINIPSPKAPSFIALEKKTGKLKWQNNEPSIRAALIKGEKKEGMKDLVDRGLVLMHGQWSNPVYAVAKGKPMVIFPGGDGWLRAFSPEDGKEIWKFDANPKDARYELGSRGARSDFIATPVVVDDRMYIAIGQDPEHAEGVGHLWCVDVTKEGDISADVVTDEKPFPPKTKPNTNSGVVWHFGGPVKKEDKEKVDRDYYYGRTMSTVAVHDGLVYAAELAGYLHCLDAKTGKEYWNFDTKAEIWGSPFWVDNKIYLGNDSGDVWVFQHGKELKEPKQLDIGDPVRSTAVAVNGTLFVMSEPYLFAFSQK